jgi:arylsulfatase A-like enzyme
VQRFFGYLHFMEAHGRHKAANSDLRKTLENLDADTRLLVRMLSVPQACKNENHRRCLQNQVYNLAVLEMRSAVADVLSGLEQRGLADNTLVLVYSDHGEEFWDHRTEQLLLKEDPRGGAGFGHGQSMYQELLHIPLLAWYPGLEGRRHRQVVSHVDVLPSILDAMGLQRSPADESGKLLPTAGQTQSGKAAERIIFSSGMAFGPEKISVRSKELKSVFTIRDDRYELYDLETDPGERSPLQDESLLMMFDTLTGDYIEMKDASAYASSSLGSKQIEELKAIGYLQGVDTDADEAEEPDKEELEEQP